MDMDVALASKAAIVGSSWIVSAFSGRSTSEGDLLGDQIVLASLGAESLAPAR